MKPSTVGDLFNKPQSQPHAKPIELLTGKPIRAKRGRKPSLDPLINFGTALSQKEIDDLQQIAEENKLTSVNQLVRYLLQHGIKELKTGKLQLKTTTPKTSLELD